MAKNNLKLYVWEDVLSDESEGIMFAFAKNKEHARELLIADCGCIPIDARAYAVWEVDQDVKFTGGCNETL